MPQALHVHYTMGQFRLNGLVLLYVHYFSHTMMMWKINSSSSSSSSSSSVRIDTNVDQLMDISTGSTVAILQVWIFCEET